MVELKKKKGGWVSIKTLHEERLIVDPDKYQIFSNLRTAIAGSLRERDGQKFIQNDGSKNYRISTHPDFISYDREKLLNHQELPVKELAKSLP